MQVYCSPCQAMFVGASRCPRCGGDLIAPEEVPAADPNGEDRPPPVGRPTLLHRFVVGVLVALGVYMGFRRLASGTLLAMQADAAAWWESVPGLTTVFGLQCAAVVLGGLMGGAARSRGFATGLLIGGLCGGLFLGAEVLDGTPPQLLTLYIQPLLLAVLGGIAGGVGSRVWPTAPDVARPVPATKTLSSVRLLIPEAQKDTERPTSWLRIAVGILIMTSGVLLADEVRTAIQRSTAGMFKVESVGQGRFVSFQLATLAVLIGGMTAGAGTGAGIRHGLYASMFAAAAVVGTMLAKTGEMPSPISYTLELLNVAIDPITAAAMAVGCTLILVGLAGGWLGGQLFLPIAPAHMRQRLRTLD